MSSQLQHKLQQFEALPSKDVWQAIDERLNDTDSSIKDLLYTFEATPPSSNWLAIETALATPLIEKKKSLYNTNWFRLAAAAVILGIVAISIFTFAIKQPKNTIASQPASQIQQNQIETSAAEVNINDKMSPSLPNENKNNSTDAEKAGMQQSNLSNTLTSTTSKRYKVVAKEDGKLVRFSQKAFAVFDCAVKATANKSERCKENIQSMQEKMASTMVSPTSDFAGLIDMIKTLEENK